MSRARDLTKPTQSRNRPTTPLNQSTQPNQPSATPFRSSPSANHDFRDPDQPSFSSPPMRPQRSAARQPGIVVSNPIPIQNQSGPRYLPPDSFEQSSYNDRNRPELDPPNLLPSPRQHPPRSVPSGSNNKLYQAINQRTNRSSPSSDSQAYLDPNYRSRDDHYPSSSRNTPKDHEKRPSTASSTGSFDNEANRDLLSANDLKDAKRVHGARNAIEAFSSQVDRRPNQKSRQVRSPPESRAVPSMLDDQSYPRTAGFSEIERVIENIKLNWDSTGITGSSNEDEVFEYSATPTVPFSAFGLALELLEGENPEANNSAKRAKNLINKKGGLIPPLSSFLKIKRELEKALQLTVQSNYRQFDASINSYKLTKTSVDSSYKKVIELKTKLTECKATLGNGTSSSALNSAATGKGTELKGLQSRRELLGEMLKLIDTIDRLKQVPERLESLISSKNFLSATILLIRSLKVINKPELAEIGGLNDLRSYLVNQESVLLEILIEELHNHLYLKNYFCNTKWRTYQPGQVTLPVICTPNQSATSPFDFNVDQNSMATHPSTSHTTALSSKQLSSSDKPSTSIGYLQSYLNDLMTQPQSNPLAEEADLLLELGTSSHSELPSQNSNQASTSQSAPKPKNQPINPELDSFKYIESLIESFAILGKLSLGLDTVLQRVPVEVYTLVESTLNEVDERHENIKRVFRPPSTDRNSLKSSISMILLFMTSSQTTPISLRSPAQSNESRASEQLSMFKFNNNELKELESIADVLQDFFWTLYSKFDGTLQSFRVLYEVSSRISERKSFKEDGIKSDLVLFSLLEVWKPIQSELLALIHAYLTESNEAQFSGADGMQANETNKGSSSSSTRNAMASIAEVLKINISGTTSTNNLNMVWKDSRKQLFKFKDAAIKQSDKEFNAHEANVYSALKVSVPGLVLDSKTTNLNSSGAGVLTTGAMIDDSSSARGNSTHRLLVQPDAFHITHLFRPTLEFLKRAKEVLPSGVIMVSNNVPSLLSAPTPTAESTITGTNFRDDWDEDAQVNLAQFGGFSSFLDEFVLHTFLPQLEEKIIHLFDHSVNAPDAFHDNLPDRLIGHSQATNPLLDQKRNSKVPVAKSLSAIVSLIECLGNLLHTSSFHQEKYGRLIISIVVQYYQKCHERFTEMVVRESLEASTTVDESNPQADMKLAATWAQQPAVIRLLTELKTSSPDKMNFKKILKKLCKIESRYMSTLASLAPTDLIQSPKKVAALAHLYTTLLSFLTFIRRLGSTIKPIADSESEAGLDIGNLETEWVKEFGKPLATERIKSGFRMPLTYGLMQRFQLVFRSFSNLAQTILFTILLELRLETYYHINQAFSRGKYFLNRTDSIEPDLKIIELNSLISNYAENLIIKNLRFRKPDLKFIFLGLVNFINDLMISNVRKLDIANEIGFQKFVKNSIALQQNLKSILLKYNLYHPPRLQSDKAQEHGDVKGLDFNFERSITFYQIASNGPQAVMESIRKGENYSFEEYGKLLELLCLSESNPRRSSTAAIEEKQAEKATGRNPESRSPDARFSRVSELGVFNDHDQKTQSMEKRKRVYNECLIELHALAFEDEDDDDEDLEDTLDDAPGGAGRGREGDGTTVDKARARAAETLAADLHLGQTESG